MSGGGGYAALAAGCAECEDITYRPSAVFYFRAGGTLSQPVRFGGELTLLLRETETTSTRVVLLSAIGQWHPATASGFYVQAGYGLARGRQDYQAGTLTARETSTGIGLVLGTGWDFPIGRIMLSPFAAMYVGALGDIEVRDPTGAPVLLKDAISTAYHLGLSIGAP